MLSTAFTWLYAIVGVPLGRLADRWSRRDLLAAGLLAWGVLTAMSGMARDYTMLPMTRLGVAVDEVTCAPTATSWIRDLFPAHKRSGCPSARR